jgi:AbrB family looped-hinge helix DNA binding protein
MAIATVSAKGWIVIPKDIREKYGIKPGDKLQVIDYGGIYMIPAVKDPAKEMRGMFKKGPSLTEALLESRRIERESEERGMRSGGNPRRKVS